MALEHQVMRFEWQITPPKSSSAAEMAQTETTPLSFSAPGAKNHFPETTKISASLVLAGAHLEQHQLTLFGNQGLGPFFRSERGSVKEGKVHLCLSSGAMFFQIFFVWTVANITSHTSKQHKGCQCCHRKS